MGTLKEHRQLMALFIGQMAQTVNGNVSCCTYKNLAGTTYTSIMGGYGFASNLPLGNTCCMLIPVATADELQNYDYEDYSITAVGTTTYTTNRTVTNDTTNHNYGCSMTFNVSINNSSADEITVNCVRFKKKIATSTSASSGQECLIYSYYFDSPLTIAAGETKTIAIDFTVSN